MRQSTFLEGAQVMSSGQFVAIFPQVVISGLSVLAIYGHLIGRPHREYHRLQDRPNTHFRHTL